MCSNAQNAKREKLQIKFLQKKSFFLSYRCKYQARLRTCLIFNRILVQVKPVSEISIASYCKPLMACNVWRAH